MRLRPALPHIRPRRTSGTWLFGAVIALQLALVFLPTAHLAFAGHGHRLNPATRGFDDVLDSDADRAAQTEPDRGPAIDDGARAPYAACPTANLSLLRYTPAVADPARVALAAPAMDGPTAPREPGLGSLPPLTIAPKQSPPLSS